MPSPPPMSVLTLCRWLIFAACLAYSGMLGRYSVALISVNLSQPGAAALHTGFLHGPAPAINTPRGQRINQLRPALWRAANANTLLRAPHYGAQPMVVLSDYWGYPLNGWKKHGVVYQQLPSWRKFVQLGARLAPSTPWLWDIWNEPDQPGFFDGSEAQLQQVFISAARTLRAQLGDQARITGPSLSHFDLPRLMRFARACIQAGVRVDVINWHEFVPARHATQITWHLLQARAQFQNNPTYAALGVQQFMITETLNPSQWLQPAAIIAYRVAMEAGAADAFARACWHHHGHSSCWDGSMDGLLAANGQPRAAWWTERALVPESGSSATRRVQVDAPLAWQVVAQPRSLVLAQLTNESDAIRLTLAGIPAPVEKMQLCAQPIPDSGYAALPKLANPVCHTRRVKSGVTHLLLPAPPAGAALWVKYHPADKQP